ncbi:MAG: Stp1/IreP family PP2C-type Ser/Thr phosphatase [Ignavibacteria bacterium]|nr:Stp1/IreP family PP2C-type Ser/Thr phosphatase [Ignavibacteria bacterium]
MDESNISKSSKFSFVCKTDLGKVRSNNEDFYDSFSSEFGEVFIVCDGMGGHSGGEIASQLATNAIKSRILKNPRNLSNPIDIIQEAIDVANKIIIDKSNEDPSLKGMGTTVVVLILKDEFAYYGHVGDSRLYLLRDNIFTSLTKDHSFVQQLVDKGLITPKEAESHPRRNEITKALGISENLIPDIRESGLKIYKGDKFLLCTDGLNTMLSDEEISEILMHNEIEEAAEVLIQRANEYGGKDNITIQIVEVIEGDELPETSTIDEIKPETKVKMDEKIEFEMEEETEVEDSQETFKKKKKLFSIVYIVFPALLVVASIVLIYLLLQGKKEENRLKTQTIDTIKQVEKISTNIINKDSIVLEILRDLYSGKKNKQLYYADSIEYTGKYSRELMDENKFLKNITDNKIEFSNIENNIIKGDTVICDYKVTFNKNKTNLYQITINLRHKPYKILNIKYIHGKEKESEEKRVLEKRSDDRTKKKKTKKQELKQKEDKKPKVETKTEKRKEQKVKEYRKDLNQKDTLNEKREENNK